MALAKALGCGVPVGAFVVGEKADGALVPGAHGTTYGGNPFATAAVSKVFDLFEKLNLVDHVNEIGAYLSEKLDELTVKYDCIKEHRGIGLMHGLECEMPVAPVITKAMDKGLIIINAGANILRFVPPLVIEKEHVDEMIQILDEVFAELS